VFTFRLPLDASPLTLPPDEEGAEGADGGGSGEEGGAR
jgi:hypothetical protein